MGQNFPYVLPLRERQTVVLAWHPDHIAGPARSTNVKPIFDGAPPCCHCTLFHARWCACGACYIAGESRSEDIGELHHLQVVQVGDDALKGDL